METILSELEMLQGTYGKKINKKKTVFISNKKEYDSIQEIRGIERVEKVKYLGMMISKDPKEIVRDAKASIRRNVTVIKSRLRLLSIPAKELVMQSFVRSLLLYFTVPLVAAKMLSLKEVDSIEREYFREILNAPKDLKREIMMNVA